MSTKGAFDRMASTYATVQKPDGTWLEGGPRAILLFCGDFTFIQGCYSDPMDGDIRRVGDGRCNGFGPDGECILSVPSAWCYFMTDEEAESTAAMMDADARLLANAF